METLQRTANRGSISTGYDIDNSLKFEADNTEIIYRTNESGTNRKTFTVSAWFKRTELGVDQQVWHGGTFGEATRIGISSYQVADDSLWVDVAGGTGNSGTQYRSFSTLKIRDTSAWYHVCVAVDTTQATEANRMKAWLNGVEVTDWSQHQIPAQNFQCALESGNEMAWGGYRPSNLVLFSGYLAECHYLDGVAKVQTDFGEYDEDSGIWKPKAYAGTYGDNGCYLNFDDSASLGADSSGNGNNFTLNNITAADQATDTPTNNFATLNPLVQYLPDGAYSFITEGATKARSTQFDVNYTYAPTFGVTSGKWYAEFEYEGSQADNLVGILDIDAVVSYNKRLGETGQWSVGLYQFNGTLYVTSDSGVTSTPSWGASAADGDIISVALDMDNYFVYFAKNGTWQNSGDPTSGATGTGGVAFDSNKTVGIGCSTYALSADGIIFTNLGGYTAGTISSAASDANGYGTFEYAPPSGYYALCTKNLAEYG